jgi:hypothetical protein
VPRPPRLTSWPVVLTAALASLLALTPAAARTPTKGRAPATRRAPAITVILEHGRIVIDTDVASLGLVLQELGWPAAFVATGAPLRITFHSAAAGIAVRRRLGDANYVVVESTAGRGELRLYPEGRGNDLARRRTLVDDLARSAPRPRRPEDSGLITRLREQIYAGASPTQRARAMEELAAHASDDLILDTALELLRREENADVIESALDALEDVESVPVSPLMTFIARERRGALRSQAIDLLGKHGGADASARDFLKKLAAGADEPRVREAARSALEDLASSD